MPISSPDLADLLRRTHAAALPSEAARLEILIDTVLHTGITARLDSPASIWLHDVIAAHEKLLTPEAKLLLKETDIYGVELDDINAFARLDVDRRQIVVFSGLLRIIRAYAELITVLNLMQFHRPTAVFNLRGEEIGEAQAFSSAGFSIIADFLISGRPPAAIGDLLGPHALSNVKDGCAGASLFVMAHELGHLHLGHLAGDPHKSERAPLSLVLDEEIGPYQRDEFEADRFAYLAFSDEIRDVYMSNVLFFLGPHSFVEAFARAGTSHPFATNRAAQLAALMTKDSSPAMQVAQIIASQTKSFQILAVRRCEAGDGILYRIQEKMPIDLAYETVHEIKQRIMREHGILETSA